MKKTGTTKKWIIIGVIWLIIWQAGAMAVSSSLLLPGPVETIRGLLRLLTDGTFYMDAGATILRCIISVILSLIFGFLLSVCAYRWGAARDLLALPVAFFKAVPIMAVAIYMLLLLSSGNVPVAVCFIMCFPIVYTNLLSGLDGMDKKILEMAKVYDITGWRKIGYIYLPQLFPHFRAAMYIITGVSWKAIVTAEVLSIPQFSLGYELMNSKYYLETELLFAYVAVIVLLSLAFEKLVKYSLSKLQPEKYEKSRVKKLKKEMRSAGSPEDIHIHEISRSYGSQKVLDGFSMVLEQGKTTALMGRSGAGKTTLGRILCGLETADKGTVTPVKAAVLFQEDRLLPWLSIHDNLMLVSSDEESMKRMLSICELSDAEYKMPDELSGGMAHRVAIIRTLLYAEGADMILADEPFRGLDENTRKNVIETLWKPYTDGKTVLVITHSKEDAAELSDRIIEMK